MIAQKILELSEYIVAGLRSLVALDWKTKYREYIVYMAMFSRDLRPNELVVYARIANVPMDAQVISMLAKAVFNGVISFRPEKHELTDRILASKDYKYNKEYEILASILANWRLLYFQEQPHREVKMKILRAQCNDCGIFDIQPTPDTELYYVKFSREPRAKMRCPTCGKDIVSPVSLTTAMIMETSGIKATHWATTSLTEKSIEDFIQNIDSEINLILGG